MLIRPRRLRSSEAIRNMTAETRMSPSMLVYPIFIREGRNIIEDIPAMPGQKRYSPDTFPRILEETAKAGVKSVLLFGIPEHKDECGSEAYNENGVIQQALRSTIARAQHGNDGGVCGGRHRQGAGGVELHGGAAGWG